MRLAKAALGMVVACAVTGAEAADQTETVWNFDDEAVGKPPQGFKAEAGQWAVAPADGGKVLSQTAKNPNATFNVVLATASRAKDIDLSVKLQARAGELDQGGGLVWRARDKNNYYVARFNPLEDNFRVYKVVDGKRSKHFQNADIKASPGWHTLRVTMNGSHIECYLDGKKYLAADDATFADAGMIGLWTKADAQSWFDELRLIVNDSVR